MLRRDCEALARQLQQAIEQINGVTSARVLLDDTGDIAEIHLVGSSARKPKQIVRDTESLIYARFGIRVDYRKISLVQLDAANVSSVPNRLVFISASADLQAGDCVRVVLQSEGRAYEGTASIRPDTEKEFGERACMHGGLGIFPALDNMPLSLAHALRLNKFGA